MTIGQNDNVMKKLSKDSEVIVIGKVSAKKSFWNDDKTMIYSQVTINPYEYLKGNDESSELTITILGGEVDGIGELYTHMPTLENDEEVLLFTKMDKTNHYRIIGGELGKMKMIRDRTTGRLMTPSLQNINEIKSKIKKFIAD